MVYGPKGSGKSSLLNSAVTCLSLNKEPTSVFTVANLTEHVTTFYGKAVLSEFIMDAEGNYANEPNMCPLVAYDTWGTSGEDCETVKLRHFLEGRVSPGATMENSDTFLRPKEEGDVIHVIVFVMKLTSPMESGAMDNLISSMKVAIGKGNNSYS